MDTSPQATESQIAIRSELDSISTGLMPSDDQCFLLYFILGTFFGPDLKAESPPKSVLHRFAEALPSYTSEQLAGSHIKKVEVERVYHHVLRKADDSVVVKGPWLDRFLHGNLPMPAKYPQFPDLFPPQLHPHSRFKTLYKIIENVVFINHPESYYIKPENMERFKRLTGLQNLVLDRDGARMYTGVDDEALYDISLQEVGFNGNVTKTTVPLNYVHKNRESSQTFHILGPVDGAPRNCVPVAYSNVAPLPAEVGTRSEGGFESGMVFLPSPPTREEWGNIVNVTRSGYSITGTAAMGHFGPSIGLLDIGECEDSYLFRVSLPGVKRDEREFGCEVAIDGKVLIRGVTTTGEQTVYMQSQVFEMQTQNLCPSGHFSISFKLPGPVDPQQFSGNFGTDGILEGIVMKGVQKENN
ncbi:hypothetical protein RHMOL_Rhmol05G0199400 [Rhododendron molle]|uniref:Uncharacterized protein n=1 Tax=Rhododendron molle TaxID=49168 RepID=A0ACC0NRD1_RHOML|nr:hypothetical protein RHMOL_Rhmol05G0199400 [Rhododendron molle]